jgi:hypothetical protein
MSKQDALNILNGEAQSTASPFIPAARDLVSLSNEVNCVVGELGPGANLENIYKARRDRLAKAGQSIPLGMDKAIEAFSRVSGESLSTCYIKADDRLIYFWRNEAAVIVALVLT